MIDANQTWDVDEAIERIRELAPFNLWWAEEPTHPDDVLGHAAIARAVASHRRRHRRALRQPRAVQAAAAGPRDQLLPDRQLPSWRRERKPGRHPDGGEVRHAGVPARRRRGPVRVRAAPLDVRFHRGVRRRWMAASSSSSITCTSISRIRCTIRARPLPGAAARPATASRSSRSPDGITAFRMARRGATTGGPPTYDPGATVTRPR